MRLISRVIFSCLLWIAVSSEAHRPESVSGALPDDEKSFPSDLKNEIPSGFNEFFAGSGECAFCHSNMVNNAGESVSIVNDWRSSMMAGSSKDPFWRAKLSHESLVNPPHADALEDLCTRCHAPVGRFNAHMTGQGPYSLAEMENDPLALDGVSCTVCHQIKEESLGNYSGDILFGEGKLIWGPYPNPFGNPMFNFTGYTPVESGHVLDSRLCGSCHTLITNTVDLNGNLTGTQFVEQAIYHEWLNSGFPASGISCQSCHVPQISDDVVISSLPPWLGPRTPFGMHQLAGANVFMLRMFKDNLSALGITATSVQLDSTLTRAQRMLQQYTLHLELIDAGRTQDSLFIEVSLQNMAGHKFPSGYPSRRAFIVLTVTDEEGEVVFHSGIMDDEYNLTQEDGAYEPHHTFITDESQVQIYELVMGDVNHEPTTVLERAFVPLKDNRIPPSGFTTSHTCYDTVLIAGNAVDDDDFNQIQGIEGSGRDRVHYRIPTSGSSQNMMVQAEVFYQTVSGKWLQPMFALSSSEINAFKEYYESANKEPVLVASGSIVSSFTGMNSPDTPFISVRPNPAGDFLQISGLDQGQKVVFYALDGKKYTSFAAGPLNGNSFRVKTPPVQGVVVLTCKDMHGKSHSFKIILN